MLPVSLQARIAAEHCTSAIARNNHLLAGCDKQFLARFMTRLAEVFLMPGESILKYGDIARELNFVVQGTLTVTDEHGVLAQLVSGEGTAPNVIGPVSFLMGALWSSTLQLCGHAIDVPSARCTQHVRCSSSHSRPSCRRARAVHGSGPGE
jgi:hypothetical protein